MKILFCLTTLLTVSFSTMFAQQFAARYNGTGNGMDAVKAMSVDNAGNTYVTGSSFSTVNSDDYITIKYNSNGVQQWLARYDGPGNGSDVPASVCVDAGGNVYVTGYSDQLTGAFINNDAATVKYNPQGVQQWVARFDGTRQRDDAGKAVKADAAGNVYITGYTTVRNGAYTKKDYLIIKYNVAGIQQWVATYNGPANQDDAAVGLGLDNLGNVYVTGASFAGADPLGEQDYLTIKYSPQGTQLWTARYNGPANEPDIPTAIAVDNAGNSYITGYSEGAGLDFATLKYNSSGVQQWVARYNGTANGSDIAYAIALDKEGNVYVAGGDQTVLYNSDYRTIKYNGSGILQWTAKYNGPANDNDEAYALAVDAGSNVYVTGYINGTSPAWDIATLKYNAAGIQQWVKTYDGPGHGNDNGAAIGTDGNGNVYIAGTSTGAASNTDFVTLKYNAAGQRIAGSIPSKNKLLLYPNPAQNIFTVHLPGNNIYDVTITDVAGKKVFEQSGSKAQLQINCSNFSKGVFLLTITGNNSTFIQKVIKQ